MDIILAKNYSLFTKPSIPISYYSMLPAMMRSGTLQEACVSFAYSVLWWCECFRNIEQNLSARICLIVAGNML
jgi:hypothetical protein